jgi:hypothetical protein
MNIRSSAKGGGREREKAKGFQLSLFWRKEEGIFSPRDEIRFIHGDGLKGTGSVLFSGK